MRRLSRTSGLFLANRSTRPTPFDRLVTSISSAMSSRSAAFVYSLVFFCSATGALGCGSAESQNGATPGAAAVTWAARRGADELRPEAMEIGASQGRALTNFVLASGLRAERPAEAAWLHRVALAHALGEALLSEGAAVGPPSAEELAAWTTSHWLTVDRPAAFRTVHAVVLTDGGAPEEQQTRARELAGRIHALVAGAESVEEFKARASGLDAGGLTVKVEDLEPVAADGRVVRLGAKPSSAVTTYDPAFAAAAAALGTIGQTSPVVRTSFGYHVLRLVDHVPELRVAAEERGRLALTDVINARARTALETLLSEARRDTTVHVERSAEEATARVRVE